MNCRRHSTLCFIRSTRSITTWQGFPPPRPDIITRRTAGPRDGRHPRSPTGPHSWRWYRKTAWRWRSGRARTRPFRKAIGRSAPWTHSPKRNCSARPGAAGEVAKIDVVWQGEPYRQLLRQQFDAVVALGSLDHQPCLISHLTYVSAVLKPGARYFVGLPDRRYTADHFLPDSGLPEVLDAFAQRRTRHGARALVAPLFHGAHADAARHWDGDHGPAPQSRPAEEQHGRAMADILRRMRAGSDTSMPGPGSSRPTVFCG